MWHYVTLFHKICTEAFICECESERILLRRYGLWLALWIKKLEVTEMCALWMAAVLQTGSHLIKLSLTRREGGQEEVKSRMWWDRESHHRENRQGRKDERSGAERGLRWRSETEEREGDVRGEETAGDVKEGEINMWIQLSKMETEMWGREGKYRLKNVQTSVVSEFVEVD